MGRNGSADGKNVWELHNTIDNVEKVESEDYMEESDDDMSPKVVYERRSSADVPKQLYTDLATAAIGYFNKHNPHMTHKLVDVVQVIARPGMMATFTVTMTARPEPPHHTNPNAPAQQTFITQLSYAGPPALDSHVFDVIIRP